MYLDKGQNLKAAANVQNNTNGFINENINHTNTTMYSLKSVTIREFDLLHGHCTEADHACAL